MKKENDKENCSNYFSSSDDDTNTCNIILQQMLLRRTPPGRKRAMQHPVIPRQHSQRIMQQRRMTAVQQVQIPMLVQPELQLHKTALLQIQQIILLRMHSTTNTSASDAQNSTTNNSASDAQNSTTNNSASDAQSSTTTNSDSTNTSTSGTTDNVTGGVTVEDDKKSTENVTGDVIVDENNDNVEIKKDDKPYLALGADLSDDQKNTVLSLMGIDPANLANYNVTYVTNAQEHQYLDSYVDSSKIGSKSWSSVVIVKRKKGNGLNISTNNITYCTVGMYKNALTTAGITDADIIVAGPSQSPEPLHWLESLRHMRQ